MMLRWGVQIQAGNQASNFMGPRAQMVCFIGHPLLAMGSMAIKKFVWFEGFGGLFLFGLGVLGVIRL